MEFYNPSITPKTDWNILKNAFSMPGPSPRQIENLVFSGGGTKGVAYVGVLRVLDQMEISSQIKRYAGASAGAITAALLAAGMSTDMIEEKLPTSFMKFLDPEEGNADCIIKDLEEMDKTLSGSIDLADIVKVVWNGARILRCEMGHMGLFKGDAFLNWLKCCFEAQKVPGNITFRQLYDKTGKELHLMLCNSNYGKTLIANHINTPDMPVTLAVRCSMALPFFFYPITFNGDLYVDGGTMYNYPVEIFDTVTDPQCTLGFILDSASSILWPERSEDKSLMSHIARVFRAIMHVSYEYCFREGNASRTVFVDHGDVGTTNFNLTKQQIELLKANGAKAVQAFFQSKYGPDGDLTIQREKSFPLVVPPGKIISLKFSFNEAYPKPTQAVVVNGDLFDGNPDTLKKAVDSEPLADWQWKNTGKSNTILFVSGWIRDNGWMQTQGSMSSYNTISFDKGFNVSYEIL